MISAGSYILSAAALTAVVASLAFSAFRLRARLLPAWGGAPARLVEAITALALLIWLAEILGTAGLLYAWTLTSSSILVAALSLWWTRKAKRVEGGDPGDSDVAEETPLPAGGADLGDRPEEAAPAAPAAGGGTKSATGPAGPGVLSAVVMVGVIALVFAHWGLTTKDALDRGIFNFDSLWYHMPFAVDIVQSHSVTGLHYTDTVFTNWFYPQNSELIHATGILLAQRDTLSLFINFGFLALAFLAAWCIGRPYGRGHLSVVGVAILLEAHTLVVREPGAAKNDIVTAALLLAAVAILVNACSSSRSAALFVPYADKKRSGAGLSVGWALAAAGLAVGLAAGTKFTVMAPAAALTLAVIALAPAGRRWAAAAWWFLPALAAGGFWYLRNLIAIGNPLPQLESLGPISLPHPERLQTARPDFNVAHYATDTGVWREYFGPGLDHAFGALWPLVIGAAIVGALLAVLHGDRVVRWMGGVALFGVVAYLFTPLSAAGIEGEPVAFAINVRYAIPALLVGLALLPLARGLESEYRQWALLGGLLVVLVLTDRSDAVLRDPDRLFGLALAALFVLVPAGIAWAYSARPASASPAGGRGGRLPSLAVLLLAVLALAVLALGYPLQRHYLNDRFANADSDTSIPGMHLDSAYRWARGVEDARIGLAGTTAGFLKYGFYGTDLSNEVRYLGAKGPHGSFNAIPDCRAFRAAVNAADLDYLVTSPFLNFIHTGDPVSSPEAGWLRGEAAVTPIDRSGPVTVWRVSGVLDAAGCSRGNAPLRRIPNAPAS